MTDSRKGRIVAFLNPFDYITGSGFQIANGYIAIGSGGVKGRGSRKLDSEDGLFT